MFRYIIEKIKTFIKKIKGRGFVECADCKKCSKCDKDVWMHHYDKECNYNKVNKISNEW